MVWLQIVALLLFVVYWTVLRPRGGGKDGPPMVLESPVFPIPVIGVIMEFFKSPNSMVKRCYHDYGPVFTIPIFFKRLTFLVGPEAQSVFFKANDDTLTQQEVYDFMKPVFGPEVVYDAPKKKRQVQFQSMSNGLKTNRLKQYVAKIEEETRQYLKNEWKEQGTADLLQALSEITILTASRCLHGDDVRKHVFKDVQKLYHDLDHGLLPYTPFWPDAPTAAHKQRNWAREEMVKLFTKVIQERRLHPENSDGTDLLSVFMETKYKDGTPITEQQMTGMLIALLFAGQHTSCLSSTWTSLFVANDTTIMDRVMKEQADVLEGDMTKPLDYESVQKMEFLHQCMTEALRMCPTFIMLIRKVLREVSVTVGTKEGSPTTYKIPVNDQVVVSPTVAMRLKTVFPNPDTFDPDRYAPGREEHKIPYAYLGFGGGMHSCMGQNFAYMQVKTVLSVLFREYELTRTVKDMPTCAYEDMVVGPLQKDRCFVAYKKRVYKQE